MTDQATHLRSLLDRDHAVLAPVPPSALIGAVSYGPVCSRPAVKRHVPAVHPSRLTVAPPRPVRLARTIGICSGKGGVGKSSLAVNLAVAMSQPVEVGGLGLNVCVLDADLGMANADVLCNLKPRLTLEHVINGKCELKDVMMLAPGGFRLIPGASGVTRIADLAATSRQVILQQLMAIEHAVDVILVDCGAGISLNVAAFAAAARTTVIATTPEPTAMTDGYGMVKAIVMRNRDYPNTRFSSTAPLPSNNPDIRVVVNMTMADSEGSAVFARMDRVSTAFLQQKLRYGGCVPLDPTVAMAVRQRLPVTLHSPESPATRAIRRIAAELMGRQAGPEIVDNSEVTCGRSGFFARLAVWLGMAEYVE